MTQSGNVKEATDGAEEKKKHARHSPKHNRSKQHRRGGKITALGSWAGSPDVLPYHAAIQSCIFSPPPLRRGPA